MGIKSTKKKISGGRNFEEREGRERLLLDFSFDFRKLGIGQQKSRGWKVWCQILLDVKDTKSLNQSGRKEAPERAVAREVDPRKERSKRAKNGADGQCFNRGRVEFVLH